MEKAHGAGRRDDRARHPRLKEPAEGIMATIVNGEVLLEDGKHTGALPGRVLRNTYYQAKPSPTQPAGLGG